MTYQKIFRILKIFQNYSDILTALGFAKLLTELYKEPCIKISDENSFFTLNLETDSEFLLDSTFISANYPYIRLTREDTFSPKVGSIINYEEQKKIADMLKKKREASQAITDKELIQLHPEYYNCRNLNMMRQGWKSDIKFVHYLEQNQENAKNIIKIYHDFLQSDKYRDVYDFSALNSSLNSILNEEITNSQFFNPVTGKGFSAFTTRIKTPSSLPNKFRVGFFEWMKIIGFFIGGISSYDHQSKLIKIRVLSPGEIPLNLLIKLRGELMKKTFGGSIRSDIFMLLNLAELLIQHSTEYQSTKKTEQSDFNLISFMITLNGKKPNEIITGISQATFVSLGQAYALKNESFLNLPGWWRIQNTQDAEDMLDVLQEHKAVIYRSFDENHSDDVELLLNYRNFVSSGLIDDFLMFTTNFACLALNKIEKNRIRLFQIKNLDKLMIKMMGTKIDLSIIIQNEGFQNISKAIRIATVIGQYMKAKNSQKWDIHYGLAQKWKKHCVSDTKFIELLSDFVQRYNAETASHAERGGPERRTAVTTDDLNNVFSLIEKYGSELVAKLLLAYGYARDIKSTDSAQVVDSQVQ